MKPKGDAAIRLRIFSLVMFVSVVPLLTLYLTASAWALWGAFILSLGLSAIVTVTICPSLALTKEEGGPVVTTTGTAEQNSETSSPAGEVPASLNKSELSRLRHDILNPMSAAMGFLELMQRHGNLSDHQLRYISNINRSMERVVAVANTLPSSRSVAP